MEQLFKTQKRQSTVDIVIDNIKQLLIDKKLLPGQKIPSEGQISEGLGVSRGSVREAMKILSSFGVVEIKPGDGTYIAHYSKGSSINPLLFDFLLYGPDTLELAEFRDVIELSVVGLIIRNKDKNQEERENIYENVEDLRHLIKMDATLEQFVENDLAFHALLGKASCNHLLQKVYEFVLEIYAPTIKATHNNQNKGEQSLAVHTQITDSIKKNNLEIAGAAIDRSVDIWKNLQQNKTANSENS
ncbi:GntR family transcriptional regulator [uncultured Sphaerochaeta sp.]|uniref:FadR/GntR family transcriptional regulator n=1 Tax=uncultured Sphaerochaeta sp. TaxID=886478 RepID=UPI002A0A622F|nr:GntR family transcriptional regulator [uncultured Sphaerochaeta sp.]